MNNGGGKKFDLLAVLLVLCVFSVTILSLLLTGAGTYKNITAHDQASQKNQTEALYISNKIFQANDAGSVSVGTEDGVQVLRIESTEGGEPYTTRIYCIDGWIMELYSDAGYRFAAGDGEKITPADSLQFSLRDGLLNVEIVSEEGTVSRYYMLKEDKR